MRTMLTLAGTIGFAKPKPLVLMRSGETLKLSTSHLFTSSARSRLSWSLYSLEPK